MSARKECYPTRPEHYPCEKCGEDGKLVAVSDEERRSIQANKLHRGTKE